MTHSIFVVSYVKDSIWVPWLLKSITKFCTGWDEIVIAIPKQDKPAFDGFGLTREKLVTFDEDGRDPFICHQMIKCLADTYCTGDYVTHIDSDCVWIAPSTPETYFKDGKPIIPYTPYDTLNEKVSKWPGLSPWRWCTQKVLGFDCPIETMRRHPFVYHRSLYSEFRKHVHEKHGITFEEYIRPIKRHMLNPAESFSEFNALGSFANYAAPDEYVFMNTHTEQLPPNNVSQSWSHGGLDWRKDSDPFVGKSAREIFKELGL